MKFSEGVIWWFEMSLKSLVTWTVMMSVFFALSVSGSKEGVSFYDRFTSILSIWFAVICGYLIISALFFFVFKVHDFIERIFNKEADKEFEQPKYKLDPDTHGTYYLQKWNGSYWSCQEARVTKQQADKAISQLERDKVYYVEGEVNNG